MSKYATAPARHHLARVRLHKDAADRPPWLAAIAILHGVDRLKDLLVAYAAGDDHARDLLLADLYPDVERRVHRALDRDFRPQNQWLIPLFSTGDIVQEVFLGVVRGLEGFAEKDPEELRAWIAKLVKNRIVDRLRFHGAQRRDARRQKKPRDERGDSVILPHDDPSPSMCASLEERAALFERAILELGERERQLWRLRFEDERSFEEVASEMSYANSESARAAFRSLRAKLLVRLRRLGIELDAGGDDTQ